ncbi:MAG: 4-hydroxy-tetrahydrodipicolinate reductase [Actinomycetota bacterium]|jgi:4-hydroxy-tetrahydrodipicolinate reductase|nr:4-hydroxy-tetrahydrodipicolinate reductase [Actinomycetota bacterium]
MIKVGVIGAAGQMGSEVCKAVEADEELELVARVKHGDPLDDLTKAGTQVAVEFTNHGSAKENALFCLANDMHVVIGTTGFSDSDLSEIEQVANDGNANAFFAPNFALGAVLMMKFAAQAARYFDTAEIIERHHQRKLDAPSGTSLMTARKMNDARGGEPWATMEGETESVKGSRGGDVGGIHIHSLRDPGSVAHQDVILGAPGETLTIRHDSLDRASFMPGVLLAVKKVDSMLGLTVGLEHILDLD